MKTIKSKRYVSSWLTWVQLHVKSCNRRPGFSWQNFLDKFYLLMRTAKIDIFPCRGAVLQSYKSCGSFWTRKRCSCARSPRKTWQVYKKYLVWLSFDKRKLGGKAALSPWRERNLGHLRHRSESLLINYIIIEFHKMTFDLHATFARLVSSVYTSGALYIY
jgi:hypothetical protein